MSLNRICRLSHSIPVDQDRCAEGHPLAASLKCQSSSCNFVTDPIIMSNIDTALSLLKMHMRAAHSEVNHSGDYEKSADKQVESNSDNEKENKKTCPLCFKIFHSKLNVKRHIKIHHDGSNRQKCNDCSKTFASKTSLDYHKKSNHAEENMIQCKICDNNFSDMKTLKLHEKSHNTTGRQKIIKCVDCHKTFSSRSNLRRHDREVHFIININLGMWEKEKKEPLKVKPFKCSDCDFQTKRKHYFNLHIEKLHKTGIDRDLTCPNCQRTFKWKASLNLHMKNSHKQLELGTQDDVTEEGNSGAPEPFDNS